jgi:hypothetical protein
MLVLGDGRDLFLGQLTMRRNHRVSAMSPPSVGSFGALCREHHDARRARLHFPQSPVSDKCRSHGRMEPRPARAMSFAHPTSLGPEIAVPSSADDLRRRPFDDLVGAENARVMVIGMVWSSGPSASGRGYRPRAHRVGQQQAVKVLIGRSDCARSRTAP